GSVTGAAIAPLSIFSSRCKTVLAVPQKVGTKLPRSASCETASAGVVLHWAALVVLRRPSVGSKGKREEDGLFTIDRGQNRTRPVLSRAQSNDRNHGSYAGADQRLPGGSALGIERAAPVRGGLGHSRRRHKSWLGCSGVCPPGCDVGTRLRSVRSGNRDRARDLQGGRCECQVRGRRSLLRPLRPRGGVRRRISTALRHRPVPGRLSAPPEANATPGAATTRAASREQ